MENSNSTTTLRQANSYAYIVGKLAEMDLKEENKDGMNNISGSMTLKISDINSIKINISVNEKKKDGTDMAAYAGIKTVMSEYKSIAEVGEEEATVVRTRANVNPYVSMQTNQENVAYRSNYFNRTNEEEYKAEFEIEMFISAIVPEMNKDGDETGRILVKGWVPQYDEGIEPITLVAETDIASAIEETYNVGETVCFFGEIINNRIQKIEEVPVKIGKPRTKITYDNKMDLQITSATEQYVEGESKNPPYAEEAIRNAIQVRTEKRNAAKKASASQTSAKPSGASRGRTLTF